MTTTLDAPRTDAVPPATGWAGLHVHLVWAPPEVDAFLLDVVRPLLDGLRAAGAVADWFFIRYAEGGPHLRIRVRGAAPAAVAAIAARLRDAVAAGPPPDVAGCHGEVRDVPYVPETERYGGERATALAEDVFCRSTELALDLLARAPDRARRIPVVLDLCAATAGALDMEDQEAVRWLRGTALIWRWHQPDGLLPVAAVHRAAQEAATARGPAVVRRWSTVACAAREGRNGAGALRWAGLVRAARAGLETAGPRLPRRRWNGVWASQLHMLCNRLGIVPDEERAVAALVGACLLAPDGPGAYFDDAADAPDRAYLLASRFVEARMPEQAPRDEPVPERLRRPFPPPGPATPLPPPAPLPPGLAAALDRRASGRGDLGGRVTATALATLLHGAACSTPHRERHELSGPRRWPHPSAGAKYVARLRLAALAVDGVSRGLYDVGETVGDDGTARPVLRFVGPAPTATELVGASMWFCDGAPSGGRIDAATLPALLGLHVRTDVARGAYGQRALRFALLEAGHLAQDLALVAAATGLALTTVGGFYDDVAHELLMLDGLDDVLTYLLPLGAAPGA
jgi:thiopeptide-type bacteriocin biosynthesis protein